jgi:hypothetical protein
MEKVQVHISDISQINPVHSIPLCYLKIHCNLSLPSITKYSYNYFSSKYISHTTEKLPAYFRQNNKFNPHPQNFLDTLLHLFSINIGAVTRGTWRTLPSGTPDNGKVIPGQAEIQ